MAASETKSEDFLSSDDKLDLEMSLQNLSITDGDTTKRTLRSSIESRIVTPSPDRNVLKVPQTGLVYHEDMAKHRCLWDTGYEECPERFTRVLDRIRELGLENKCQRVNPRSASESEILSVHDQDYIDLVKTTRNLNDEAQLEKLSSKFDAVYFHPQTYDLALLAAGSAIDLTTDVVSGRLKNGFGLIRPPGHHAMKAEACGYCIFNNVALAAKHAVQNLGLERVLIVDWDVHHGQATQYTFDDDPRVLYTSIHRYEYGTFWPELIESNSNWVGRGPGKGYNCNIPLNETRINDKDYLSIFHNLILPLAYNFNPQLVLISAGYDAAIGCPEGEMLVSPATYAHFCHSLMALADGKVCVFLEGGYCLSSLAESAALTLRSLLGYPCPPIIRLPHLKLHRSVFETVFDCIWALKPFWKDVFPLQGTFDRKMIDEECLRTRYLPIVEYKGPKLSDPAKPEEYPTRNCYPVQDPEIKRAFEAEIARLKLETDLPSPQEKQTIIVYNELMTKHKCPGGAHPERASRITSIYKYLVAKRIDERCTMFNGARYATDEELLLVHSQEHIDNIKKIKGLKQDEITKFADTFDSIYMNKSTEECARLAAGSLLSLVDRVMTGQSLNGMAIVRPPGHHAARDVPSGFCIFNNIAIAAKYIKSKYGKKKIMIVDFDVHHGDGTQSLVQGDEDILFVSTHRYDCAQFFPSVLASGLKQEAKNIINIPWNHSIMGSSEYIAALLAIILPVAYDFIPDVVLVSAGFDAAINDPLGQYKVSPETYAHFIHQLMTLAGGKMIISLEGGYNLDSISRATYNCILSLLGSPPASLELNGLDTNAQSTLQEVSDFQSSRWPSLQFGVDLPFNDS